MVGGETVEESEPGSRDVEGSVGIEQPLPRVAADDGSKAEVTIACLLVNTLRAACAISALPSPRL